MRLVAVLFLLSLISSSVSSDVSIKTVETVQKSVVPFICIKLDSNRKITFRTTVGTGFFINRNGDFVTAAHVITSLKNEIAQHDCFGAVYVPKGEWKARYQIQTGSVRWFATTGCYFRTNTDLGVCRVGKNNPFVDNEVNKFIRPIALASFTKYSDGSAVAFTGFPLQSVFPITSKGYIASYDAIGQKLIVDKAAWPGASGSPVYSPEGKAIAVIIERGDNVGAGLAYARPTDLVFDLLREQAINVEK